MSTQPVIMHVPADTITALDTLVALGGFRTRADALQAAVAGLLRRQDGRRFLDEYAKLDPAEEIAMAAVGLERDRLQWPEY